MTWEGPQILSGKLDSGLREVDRYVTGLVPQPAQKAAVHHRLELLMERIPPDRFRPERLAAEQQFILYHQKLAPDTHKMLIDSGWARSSGEDQTVIASAVGNVILGALADECSHPQALPKLTADLGSFNASCETLLLELEAKEGLSAAGSPAGVAGTADDDEDPLSFVVAAITRIGLSGGHVSGRSTLSATASGLPCSHARTTFLRFELVAVPRVASAVLLDLLDPVVAICLLREPAVERAAMPEAAVDEDGELCLWKDEIRSNRATPLNRDGPIDSKSKAATMEERSDRKLRTRLQVSIRLHDPAAESQSNRLLASRRRRDVVMLVGGGTDVDLDQPYIRIAQMTANPACIDQDGGLSPRWTHRATPHRRQWTIGVGDVDSKPADRLSAPTARANRPHRTRPPAMRGFGLR